MGRARVHRLFRAILSNRKPAWKFNMSPLFMEFLMGGRDYECSPWGMPTYNIFGWQRPCYLLQEGYAESFNELLETTDWKNYGAASGNPKCANCMVSCGYETTANIDGFGTVMGFWGMVRGTFSKYNNPDAMKSFEEPATSGQTPLTQIEKICSSADEATRKAGRLDTHAGQRR
jgi:hypothetical protein